MKDEQRLLNLTPQGYHDTEYATSQIRDILGRSQSEEKPVISVEIKHIVKKVLKGGQKKREYGFVFQVNGEALPICFGSKDRTMLYVCTLLRKKMGENMYLHEFYKNSKGRSDKARFKRTMSRKWLQAVYETVFPFDQKDFNDWIGKVERDNGHPLNQGKSRITALLGALFETCPTASQYCTLNTREDELGDSFYCVMIEPERITIPNEMQFLIDEFDDLMGN